MTENNDDFMNIVELNDNDDVFIPPPQLMYNYQGLKQLPIDYIIFMRPSTIHCNQNYLTELPHNMPDSVWNIFCSNNHIYKLPNTLPVELEHLYCGNNNISALPDTLPQSLAILDIQENPLMALPDNIHTYINLRRLNITKCLITALPQLPESLECIIFYESDPVCEYVRQNGIEIEHDIGIVTLFREQIQILNEFPARKRIQARTRIFANELNLYPTDKIN